jgi:heptosyltransferase-2
MAVAKEKIVVVMPNHLGDVVMATPALRALRAGRPDARIEVLVREPLAPVLEGSPRIDQIWPHRIYQSSGHWGRWTARRKLGREVGGDTVLVFPNSFSGALLATATRATRRVGYRRNARGLLLTDRLAPPREHGRRVPLAMERYYLDLVKHLGCPDTGTEMELFLGADDERETAELFQKHDIDATRPLVCLAPGAGFGPSKIWPLEHLAHVSAELQRLGLQVALVHAPNEQDLADHLLTQLAPGPTPALLGGRGMHLGLLKAVLSKASLLICNDAGARHVSAAFGVPTLVLMGPTSVRYTNLNLAQTRLLREPVACSPCQLKVCPLDHRCMTGLRPERVLEEAKAALFNESWQGHVQQELGANAS